MQNKVPILVAVKAFARSPRTLFSPAVRIAREKVTEFETLVLFGRNFFQAGVVPRGLEVRVEPPTFSGAELS
jgi:hypothetical protein